MWIREYRKKYGLSRAALGKLAECSGELIYIVETGGITHPGIADRIASVCNAGRNERNSIVDGSHWREGWKQIPKYRARGEKAEKTYYVRLAREKKELAERKKREAAQEQQEQPTGQPTTPENGEVVVINRVGQVIARYPSCEAAAWQYALKTYTVRRRCEGRIGNTDEFKIYDVTFRYAAEWDSLTGDERLKRAAEAARTKKRRQLCIPVADVYSWQGQTHSAAEWARIAGMAKGTLYSRLQKGWDFERAMKTPVMNREK